MRKNQFAKTLKIQLKENAIIYLEKKQGSKGKENIFEDLSMVEYLQPSNKILTITEKQRMFEVKTRMVNLPSNFPKPNIEYICPCGEKEVMEHVYNCEILNDGVQPNLRYEKLYNGNLFEQCEVFRTFEKNFEKRKTFTKESPSDRNFIRCSCQSVVIG